METMIQETMEAMLTKLSTPFRKVKIDKKDDDDLYRINIESEEPSLLIGHHGENIQAMQSLMKTILWRKTGNDINILVDIDDYRKRQEQNVLSLAERKIDTLRKTGREQSLPPMSAYFRRVVHMHVAKKFADIETQSVGEGDMRYLTLKIK
jgi:spoIIIJ-associated protein